jgi:hypothetical protein
MLPSLLCKKIIFPKSKEVKSQWSNSRQIWQNLLRKIMAQKRGCFASDDDDDDEMNKYETRVRSRTQNAGSRERKP